MPQDPRRKGPGWRVRFAFAVGGLLIALIAAETTYRLVLRAQVAQALEQPGFPAVNRPIYAYDQDLGYRYVAGSRALRVTFHEGAPVDVGPLLVNAEGNIGTPDPDWNTASERILVVGDSFTANPYRGITWTDHLSGELEPRIARDVAVLNLGRDGYGLLQMVHQAAVAVATHRPTRIVVAFIAEDLTRARFWRFVTREEGTTRLLTTYRPGSPHPDQSVDKALVDKGITPDWARALGSGAPDPVTTRLTQRYRRLALAERGPDLARLDRSYLANRILHGDPFADGQTFREFHWPGQDYMEDPIFRKDVAILRGAGIPIDFLLLPVHSELAGGQHQVSQVRQALFNSLQDVFDTRIVDVMARMRIPPGQLDALFLLPFDRHPSRAGAKAYAQAIAKALAERMGTMAGSDERESSGGG